MRAGVPIRLAEREYPQPNVKGVQPFHATLVVRRHHVSGDDACHSRGSVANDTRVHGAEQSAVSP